MHLSKKWYLYIIRTVDNQLYTGITTDVRRRFIEHMSLGGKAARYLKAHRPKDLVFSLLIGNKSLAYKVEYHFKRLKKHQKETIVRINHLSFNNKFGTIDLE